MSFGLLWWSWLIIPSLSLVEHKNTILSKNMSAKHDMRTDHMHINMYACQKMNLNKSFPTFMYLFIYIYIFVSYLPWKLQI